MCIELGKNELKVHKLPRFLSIFKDSKVGNLCNEI